MVGTKQCVNGILRYFGVLLVEFVVGRISVYSFRNSSDVCVDSIICSMDDCGRPMICVEGKRQGGSIMCMDRCSQKATDIS